MNLECLELKNEQMEITNQLRHSCEQLQLGQTENQVLTTETQELQNRLQMTIVGNHVPPDYEAIKARTLNKLKVGRQSAAGRAIDAFIREL